LLVFSYIYISQGSVEMHSRCGEIYKNHVSANCQHSVSVKNRSITGKDMDKNKVPRFYWPMMYNL